MWSPLEGVIQEIHVIGTGGHIGKVGRNPHFGFHVELEEIEIFQIQK